jgi:HSP20 family protein
MSYTRSYKQPISINEFNKLIDQTLRPWINVDKPIEDNSQWIPRIDVMDEKNKIVILSDLPGVEKDQVSISIEDNILIFKGVRTDYFKTEIDNYRRKERVNGNFERRFNLPNTVDVTKIEASLQKGILQITIFKKDSGQPRFIKIKDCE